MATKIEIYDGETWWASPDIWIVPGDDPNGTPGQPVAGQTNYVWANVHNNGTTDINGIRVNFYWSNPATGVLRSTSTLIGSGYVDLREGETKQVLCISPWVPIVVNGGHECLVAEALTNLDPLPTPLSDEFDPKRYHQIAQKNVQVISFSSSMASMIIPIQISATPRKRKSVKISIQKGKLSEKEQIKLFNQLGINPKKYKEQSNSVLFGLSEKNFTGKDFFGASSIDLKIHEKTSQSLYVHLGQSDKPQSGFEILLITETIDKKVVGGNTIIILKD